MFFLINFLDYLNDQIGHFLFFSSFLFEKLHCPKLYKECVSLKNLDSLGLRETQLRKIQMIVDKEETFKGVYTVLTTSLVYKSNNPNQDIRLHQANMNNGYSGRNFDTRFITPFLKQKQFLGAMKESGWLTRSLKQNLPYTLDYPGKISNIDVKKAFLEILDDIEKIRTYLYHT